MTPTSAAPDPSVPTPESEVFVPVPDPSLEAAAVVIDRGSDRVVVALSGDIDTASSVAVEGRILAALDGVDGHLDLDLTKVTFLDSSGLRALLVVQQAVVARGSAVRLVGSTPMIDRLLEITGLGELFPAP